MFGFPVSLLWTGGLAISEQLQGCLAATGANGVHLAESGYPIEGRQAHHRRGLGGLLPGELDRRAAGVEMGLPAPFGLTRPVDPLGVIVLRLALLLGGH